MRRAINSSEFNNPKALSAFLDATSAVDIAFFPSLVDADALVKNASPTSVLLTDDDVILGYAATAFDGYRAKLWRLRLRLDVVNASEMLFTQTLPRLHALGAIRCIAYLPTNATTTPDNIGFCYRSHCVTAYCGRLDSVRRHLPSLKQRLTAHKVSAADCDDTWPIIEQLLERVGKDKEAGDDSSGFKTFVNNPGSACFLFRENGAVVGSVHAGFDGLSGTIWHLQVDPVRQGVGFGKEIVSFLVHEHWKGDIPVHFSVINGNA